MDYDETEYIEDEAAEQECEDGEYAEYYYEADVKTEAKDGEFESETVYYEVQEAHFEDENVNEQNYEGEYILDTSNNDEEENTYSNFLVENEVEIGTSEIITDSKKRSLAATNSLKKNSTQLITNNNEGRKETKPTLNSHADDLLSTFFKEVEETVRSFLPSVVIEAKVKIANLINKLEMRNWQVQQQLKEKEKEQMQKLRKAQNKHSPQHNKQIRQQSPQQLKQQKKQHSKQTAKLEQQPQTQQEIKLEEPTQQQIKLEELTQHQSAEEEETEPQDHQKTYKLQEPIPVVLKYGPNVSVICLPNEVSAFSQPLIKVREITGLQNEIVSDT